MKRIYLLLLITIIPLNLFCQQKMVLDSTTIYEWNEDTNDYEERAQCYYTYSGSGYLIEEFYYGRSFFDDSLRTNGTRILYSYDANGNLIEETTYRWDDNSWIETQRYCWMGCFGGQKKYSYDSQDNIILFLWNSWNPYANIWQGWDSIIYTYDGNGYIISEVSYGEYQLDIDEWPLNDSTVYTYDANGNQTEKCRYYWDRDQNKWKGCDPQWVYTYDANGNLTKTIRYQEVNSRWRWFQKNVYTYYSNGNLTSETCYVNWNNGLDDERWVYKYDAHGNRTMKTGFHWEFYKWVQFSRYVYTYDAYGNLTEENLGYWDSETNDWRSSTKRVSYWSELITQIGTSSEQHQCIIYPNPTNSQLTIETDQPDHYSINITTLNGQQVFSGEMEGSSRQLDLSSFQKGVYFITIRSNGFVTTRKIVKL